MGTGPESPRQDTGDSRSGAAAGRIVSPGVRRGRAALVWAVAATVAVESVTLVLRFGVGASAEEFNRTAPLLLQLHHMFWSVPMLAFLPLVWRRPRLSGALLGISLGLIASDALHHLVVLPLTVGNTGWHWP
jgi:hypothetical protein